MAAGVEVEWSSGAKWRNKKVSEAAETCGSRQQLGYGLRTSAATHRRRWHAAGLWGIRGVLRAENGSAMHPSSHGRRKHRTG